MLAEWSLRCAIEWQARAKGDQKDSGVGPKVVALLLLFCCPPPLAQGDKRGTAFGLKTDALLRLFCRGFTLARDGKRAAKGRRLWAENFQLLEIWLDWKIYQ